MLRWFNSLGSKHLDGLGNLNNLENLDSLDDQIPITQMTSNLDNNT